MEYKLMSRYELTEYIVDFWSNCANYKDKDRDYDELFEEVYNNLGSLEGIESELDNVRDEFDNGYPEDSIEYQKLDEIWNYINWYKTAFGKAEKIINLLYNWVGKNYGGQEMLEPSYDLDALGMYLEKELRND